MSWRNYLRRDRADREWREEMEAHIEIATDVLIAQGMMPEEGRAATRRQHELALRAALGAGWGRIVSPP